LLLLGVMAPAAAAAADAIVVRSSTELLAALTPSNSGRTIQLAPGEYVFNVPLVVPDRVTLKGSGSMRLDENGSPDGLDPTMSTTIKAGPGLSGDLVTLGNFAALERVRIEDVESDSSASQARTGNTVAVYSRRPRDSVTATITDCEIVNPNRFGFDAGGPTGHGVIVLTRNPGGEASAHEAAKVSVRIRGSLLRAPRSSALFVDNFAAAGRIETQVEQSRLEGTTAVIGGTSRPRLVTQAITTFKSRANHYLQGETSIHPAWQLVGGSGATHLGSPTNPGADSNILRVESVDDRIEASNLAIQASGGRRVHGMSGPSSGNVVLLGLVGTTLLTGNEGADLVLAAAVADAGPSGSRQEFHPGDGNIVRVSIRGARGSGVRPNRYGHVSGPKEPANLGTRNGLEFVGRREHFLSSNPGISPAPGPEFFPEDRSR
jgi:hypothetical protein